MREWVSGDAAQNGDGRSGKGYAVPDSWVGRWMLILTPTYILHTPYSKLGPIYMPVIMSCLFPSFVLKVLSLSLSLPSPYSYTVELELQLAIHQHSFSRRPTRNYFSHENPLPSACGESIIISPSSSSSSSSYRQIKLARRQSPNPQGQVRKRVRSTDILNTALSPSSPRPAC